MLLGQAYISIESIIDDWNLTGWEPMANFVWWAAYENAVYKGKDTIANIGFVGMAPDLEKTNDISLVELGTSVQWASQAAAAFISSDVREATFLRHFQFFFPMLLQIAKINPEVFRKSFVRWMHWAATELEMRGHKFLLPSESELAAMPPEQVATLGQGMLTSLKGGASAQNALTGAPETGGGTE
jgi:hypothetical protein